jgi:hypothetical protein
MSDITQELLLGFGDVIDRLVCTPGIGQSPVTRKGRRGIIRNRYLWRKVYDDTRKRFGRPLTLLAAEKLIETVSDGDFVIIVTNSHEMDGPPGAAALARALIVGLNAIPVILTSYPENSKLEMCLPQTCIGAQLNPVIEIKELYEGIWSPYSVLIRNWPSMTVAGAIEASKKFLNEFKPKAIIATEVVSCNKKGVRHGALGGARNTGDPEEEMVRWNQLLDLANEREILTIAVGDNGNEAGFGTIEEICKKHHKFCADCGCPCGEGIVSASKADIVLPATSSNWGCYGIEACLAKLLGKQEVMHDEYTHNRILLNCANVGIPDGSSAMITPTTDGASHKACIYTVGQLRQTVIMSFVELVRENRRIPKN